MKIKIVTTGGTIDKVYFDSQSEFQIGDSLVKDLLREANVTVEFDVMSVLKKDSLDMTKEDRIAIRKAIEADPGDRFLVTHGTDTMRDTADVLKGIPGKVIVLTGAMQPARFRNTDAVFNIGCAFTAVQTLKPGVYIVMNGNVFEADKCKKNRAKSCFEPV